MASHAEILSKENRVFEVHHRIPIAIMIKGHCRSGRTWRHRHHRSERPVACNDDPDIIQLRRWMKKAAHFSNSLQPVVFKETGRGLWTKRSICHGETIVSVPCDVLITTQAVLHSDIGQFIKGWEPKLTAQQCLSVFLIWERHKKHKSAWFPFINVLPASYTTPAYFTTPELQLLPVSVREQAIAAKDKVKTMYDGLIEFCKHSWDAFYDILSFDIFKWAWSAINTRSVFYEPQRSEHLCYDDPDNIALAPFLDLLNHSSDAAMKAGFNAENNCYEIITYDTYKAYEQVFISYGCHGNHKLFVEYGFCVPNNQHDVFEFMYDDIVRACRQFQLENVERKCAVLRDHKLLQGLTCSMDGLSWKLWTTLKTLAMSWDQLQDWNTIYMDESKFDNTVPTATALAKYLLQNYILKIKHQERLALQHSSSAYINSEHLDIALTLIKVEKEILTTCLKQL